MRLTVQWDHRPPSHNSKTVLSTVYLGGPRKIRIVASQWVVSNKHLMAHLTPSTTSQPTSTPRRCSSCLVPVGDLVCIMPTHEPRLKHGCSSGVYIVRFPPPSIPIAAVTHLLEPVMTGSVAFTRVHAALLQRCVWRNNPLRCMRSLRMSCLEINYAREGHRQHHAAFLEQGYANLRNQSIWYVFTIACS